MKVRSLKGIEVEFTPKILLSLSTEIGLDEIELKRRFYHGVYVNAYVTQNGSHHTKYAVLWNEKRGKPYVFTCRLFEAGKPWIIFKVGETCPGHTVEFGVGVNKNHIDQAKENLHRYTCRQSYQLCVLVVPPTGDIQNVQLANVRISCIEDFKGSGKELLERYVPLEKFKKMEDVTIPIGSELRIQVRNFGKGRVVRSFPL